MKMFFFHYKKKIYYYLLLLSSSSSSSSFFIQMCRVMVPMCTARESAGAVLPVTLSLRPRRRLSASNTERDSQVPRESHASATSWCVRPTAVEPRRAPREGGKTTATESGKAKLPVEQTAAAISKKTPEWFHISGVPVRPLTARESRRAPPTSNKARVLKPKTQVEVQKEKMVGTSPSNPHYFRLPYKRKDVGKGGVIVKGAQDRSKGSAVGRPAARPPSAPPAGARKPPTNPSAQEVIRRTISSLVAKARDQKGCRRRHHGPEQPLDKQYRRIGFPKAISW